MQKYKEKCMNHHLKILILQICKEKFRIIHYLILYHLQGQISLWGRFLNKIKITSIIIPNYSPTDI